MSTLIDSILKELDKLAAEDNSDVKTPFTTSADPIVEKLWVEPITEQKTLLEE
jgi:hypothetical protein